MNAKTVALGMTVLLLVSCGPAATPSGKAGGKPGPMDPNQVARSMVEAVAARDSARVAALATDRLAQYFTALDSMRTILAEVVRTYEELYPDQRDDPVVKKLRHTWQKPLAFYRDIRLDGKLAAPGADGGRRYRISWQDPQEQPVEAVMSLVSTQDGWRVSSLGRFSPTTAMVASIRSQLSELQFTVKEALQRVRREKPATVGQAHMLFSQVRTEMMKGSR